MRSEDEEVLARDRALQRMGAERDRLRRECEEKEAVIQRLAAELETARAIGPELIHRLVVAENQLAPKTLSSRLADSLIRLGCPHRFPLGLLHQYPPRPLRLEQRMPVVRPDAPGFCVVTPSFEQGAFIERTVRSVLDQGYPRLRYGVQDGGSRDNTLAVLEKFSARLDHVESAPDAGQGAAINAGFAKLGPRDDEIMAWVNSDDILLPGALAYVANFFARHPEVDAVYGHRIILDENDGEVGRWFLPRHRRKRTLAWVDFVPQETLFWRASVWRRSGGIDPGYRFAMDWAFLVQLEASGAVIRRLPRFLGGFRVHGKQKTHLEISSTGLMEMNKLRARHGLDVVEAEKRIHRAVQTERLRSRLVQRLWQFGVKI